MHANSEQSVYPNSGIGSAARVRRNIQSAMIRDIGQILLIGITMPRFAMLPRLRVIPLPVTATRPVLPRPRYPRTVEVVGGEVVAAMHGGTKRTIGASQVNTAGYVGMRLEASSGRKGVQLYRLVSYGVREPTATRCGGASLESISVTSPVQSFHGTQHPPTPFPLTGKMYHNQLCLMFDGMTADRHTSSQTLP